MRDWQGDLLADLLAEEDGRLRHRRALIGMPRKNGKSSLLSALAMWALYCGPEGGEVYSLAGDREQARITFDTARRMIELSPELSARSRVFRNAIEFSDIGSVWRVVSSDAPLKEGLSPTFVLVDEVHVIDQGLWDVMSLAMGSRREPLMVGITTAGVKYDSTGGDSLCYRLFEYGKKIASGELDDPSFFFRWWGASDEADFRDPKVWKEANPGFDDIVAAEDFSSSALSTPENEFRTKRLNQWVSSHSAWLPQGAWDACGKARTVPDGAEVVLGFDGSYSGDSTALVAATCEDVPHLFVVEAWERKDSDDPNWRVDIAAVEQAIREACARWNVREVACDPYRWERSMQALEDEGWPIVEWPTGSPARMVPACAKFYDSVMEQRLTHDGDARLARHIDNCVLKTDGKGPRIVKEHKMSPRKIDLAVCAVLAHDRATFAHEGPGEVWFAFT